MERFNRRMRCALAAGTLAACTVNIGSNTALGATLTLGDGDVVSISGAGTIGTVGGSPMSDPSASAYISADNNASVRVLGSSQLTVGAGATIENTGLGHAIYAEGTSAITLSGGTFSMPSYKAGLANFSSVDAFVSGGTFNVPAYGRGLQHGGSGSLHVTGGTYNVAQYGTGIFTSGGGPLLISGGTFSSPEGTLVNISSDAGPVTISGGSFTTGGFGNGAAVSGTQLDLIGGSFVVSDFSPAIYATNNATVRIAGGSFSANHALALSPWGATITLYGSNFVYTPEGGSPTAITSGTLPSSQGTITGTLLNGDVLSTTYSAYYGTLRVNVGDAPPVPEPAGLAIFVAAGALALSRRRAS